MTTYGKDRHLFLWASMNKFSILACPHQGLHCTIPTNFLLASNSACVPTCILFILSDELDPKHFVHYSYNCMWKHFGFAEFTIHSWFFIILSSTHSILVEPFYSCDNKNVFIHFQIFLRWGHLC